MDKIFSLIEEKTKQELAKISRQKERDIFGLQKHFKALCQKEKEKTKSKAKDDFKKELFEYEQKLEQNNHFALLKEKQKILENVFLTVKEKLSEEQNDLFEEFIINVVKSAQLPEKGEILAGEKTASILKKNKKNLKIKAGLNEEGFVFSGKDFELDFSLSSIIGSIKQASIFELSKILFP